MLVNLNASQSSQSSGVPPGPSLIIHDGFHEDPDRVRSHALSRAFGRAAGDTYPGQNSQNHAVDGDALATISRLVNAPVRPSSPAEFGLFRLSRQGDPGGNFIHADPAGWVGVAYLNPQADAQGGTAFWRHKGTALEAFPWRNWSDYGYRSLAEAWTNLVCEDGNVPDRWDLVMLAPTRYNRLVLFNSGLFHSHYPRENFGDTVDTCRLVQVFFFSTPDREPFLPHADADAAEPGSGS